MEISAFTCILAGTGDEGHELDERGAQGASRHSAGGNCIMDVFAKHGPRRMDMTCGTINGLGQQHLNGIAPAQPLRPLRQLLVGMLSESERDMILVDTNVASELVRPEPEPAVVAWACKQPPGTL